MPSKSHDKKMEKMDEKTKEINNKFPFRSNKFANKLSEEKQKNKL